MQLRLAFSLSVNRSFSWCVLYKLKVQWRKSNKRIQDAINFHWAIFCAFDCGKFCHFTLVYFEWLRSGSHQSNLSSFWTMLIFCFFVPTKLTIDKHFPHDAIYSSIQTKENTGRSNIVCFVSSLAFWIEIDVFPWTRDRNIQENSSWMHSRINVS